MKRFEFELEQVVFSNFKKALENSDLKLVSQDRWKTSLLIRKFDIVIYEKERPLGIIEVKARLENKNMFAIATDQVRSAMSITNSRFGIVTDSESYYILDRTDNKADFKKTTFEEIIQLLKIPLKVEISNTSKEDVVTIIRESAKFFLPDLPDFKKFLDNNLNTNSIQFDKETMTFYLVKENSFENTFFKALLGKFDETEICRFSTLKTIFDSINFFSLRMNGLAGMNDTTEVNYIESYFDPTTNIANEELEETRERNKRYISSCTLKKNINDLTLWRLYADDGKGVAMIFDINDEKTNDNIFIHKVKYAREDKTHPELDFLQSIIKEVEYQTGFVFKFHKFNYWKHFFKPYEYNVEEEVRILVIDEKKLDKVGSGWLMTNTHSIINPYIDLRLNNNNFPLKLKKVILGPKCPEKELNKIQLTELIRQKEFHAKTAGGDIKDVEIEISIINNYR